MKRFAETAYWIYAAGAAASFAVAFFVLSGRGAGVDAAGNAVFVPLFGPLTMVHLATLTMIATVAYGLFVAFPVLKRSQSQHDQLNERAAQLEVAVVTDPLTGLYNRRYFEDALEEYMREFTKIGVPLAVLTLDLDHFKSVNDTFGHDAGDEVLKQLARRLQGLTREHDIVARTGGEEFCIVAPFADAKQIRPFAERICRMVGEMRVDVGHAILRPTISIGVASTVSGVGTPKQLLKISDERLYEAKKRGRNRVCL